MATKFVYTDAEVSAIIQQYKAGVSLEDMATKYNKSVASVRMKLVKLGVYVAKSAAKAVTATTTAKPKAATAPRTKSAEKLAFKTAHGLVGDPPW